MIGGLETAENQSVFGIMGGEMRLPRFVVRLVCVPLIGILVSGLLCLFLGYSNLVYKVFCGKGLCMICAGKINATIKGRPGRWRYFIVKRDRLPPDVQDIFWGKYRNGGEADCWIVVHDNRSFPFGDLYWLSENDMLISKNGLWGNLSLFGKWILLSEVALHCTYDVCNDMKGLAAELDVINSGGIRRYVCRPSKHYIHATGDTNIIFSADISVPLLKMK